MTKRTSCPSRSAPGARRAPGAGERGALTLSYVIIVPVFLMSLMIIAQASVWYMARETALAAARQGADVARTAHPPPGAGAQAAVTFARSAAPGFLLGPSASAAGTSATTVMITVTGRVPSLVPGMVITVSEVVTAPIERFTAAGPLARGPLASGDRHSDRYSGDRYSGDRHSGDRHG
ncbi:MAG TPA: TadE family protein [Streptosporangiaceae bacterium]|nr:TadE family protein [Streptosporangiaceae bacterium]